jgi:hypothetical protein
MKIKLHKLRRRYWVLIASLCGIVASGSCSIASWFPDSKVYGMYGAPPAPLTVKSFSFAPLGPIHTGELLTMTAEIEPVANPSVRVYTRMGVPGGFQAELRDDGVAPDQVAGDYIFTGTERWLAEYGTGKFTLYLSAGGGEMGHWAQGQAESGILKVKP